MERADTDIIYCRLDEQGHLESKTAFLGSWQQKIVRTATDKGALVSSVIIVRTPDLALTPRVGDMLVTAQLGDETVTDVALKRAGAVTIKAVSDNRKGMGGHWKMEAV